jgi:hypothetical protein
MMAVGTTMDGRDHPWLSSRTNDDHHRRYAMSSKPVEIVDRGPKAISRSIVVDISAAEIFARLENPHRHHELDGSGTVQANVEGPTNLHPGDTFQVRMKMFGLPYKIRSTVVRFEQDRDIEWRHPAGHTWRWQLEPLSPTRTRVIETWDYSQNPAAWSYKFFGVPRRNTKGIEQTLRGLERAITS